MSLLAVESLSKTYKRGVRALDQVTLSVEPGQIFGLLGPNGAGKTTLVKILLGLRWATGGTATILGRPVGHPAARAETGYLPEDHQLPAHLTARRAMQMYCLLQGESPRERRGRIDELLDRLALADRANEKIRGFSKGMKQRLGLAQALLHQPKLVFLDEPTDGVDPAGRGVVREMILEEHRRGTTVFINSHLLDEVERICDEVAILRAGRLIRRGPLCELLEGGDQLQYRVRLADPPPLEPLLPAGANLLSFDGREALIGLPEAAALDGMIDALRGAGVGIRAILPLKRSLEEYFIAVTEEADDGA